MSVCVGVTVRAPRFDICDSYDSLSCSAATNRLWMDSRTAQERGETAGTAQKKRAHNTDTCSESAASYTRATTRHGLSAANSVQRSRIVAERFYAWCAERDDSGHAQLISDTVRSEAYVLCEMNAFTRDALIVMCSNAFSQVTGFPRKETIGRPISMLHGPKTNHESAGRVESAMKEGVATTVQLTSYTRSGQPFWNLVHIVPVPLETSTSGKLAFVLLTNVSKHLLCGGVGQFPIGLDFLSQNSSDFPAPRQLPGASLAYRAEHAALASVLGASLACRAEHAALASVFQDCETTRGLSFCIVNPALEFCPISFASDAFLELNGCDAQSVLGHSCCLAGGLPTDSEQLGALLRAWRENELPLAVHMVRFSKDHNGTVLHDAQLAPLVTADGAVARIVVVMHLPSTEARANDVIAQQAPPQVHLLRHVLQLLAVAEATDGCCPQFFLRLQHARC